MSVQVQAALIAGVVAFLTALTGTAVTVLQARRERSKWLVDLKASYTLELYQQRLLTYPEAFKIIGRLSHGAVTKPDPSVAGDVARELNDWLYGAGGLCAEAGTRGAVLGLRERCRAWARSGDHGRPEDFYEWRNVALAMLRLDIDVGGLEQYDFGNMPSVLERLKREVEQMIRNSKSGMPRRIELRSARGAHSDERHLPHGLRLRFTRIDGQIPVAAAGRCGSQATMSISVACSSSECPADRGPGEVTVQS